MKPVHVKIQSDFLAFLSQIDRAVKVSRDKFTYPLSPKIVGHGMELVATLDPNSFFATVGLAVVFPASLNSGPKSRPA